MSDETETPDAPAAKDERARDIRSFARHGGRPLSTHQRGLLATRLPDLRLPETGDLDLATLFGGKPVFLEIGFGGGEHLAGQAARAPELGFIGAEPFFEGVAKAVRQIDALDLTNVRLWPGDARALFDRLPEAALAGAYILFPDPWPKRRQQKRRLVSADFAARLARVCQPGARVRFATDVRSYADAALLAFLESGRFTFTPARADDWRLPPPDHLTTRYEVKRLGDCAPVWFDLYVCARGKTLR